MLKSRIEWQGLIIKVYLQRTRDQDITCWVLGIPAEEIETPLLEDILHRNEEEMSSTDDRFGTYKIILRIERFGKDKSR